MFSLQRVFGYAVEPQWGTEEQDVQPPVGGAARITPKIREVIAGALKQLDGKITTTVDFTSFTAGRKHVVRDELRILAFGHTRAPLAAAGRLAERLSETTDNRSSPALFLQAVEANEEERRVTLLVLPREENALTFQIQSEEVLIDAIQNAFSAGSHLRKVARIVGRDHDSSFLSVDLFDFQMLSSDRAVADFWIKRFLVAQPSISSESGSRALAQALRRALEASPETDRDAVFGALHMASSGQVRRTSLAKFADNLPEAVHDAYFKGLDPAARTAVFDVSAPVIKTNVGRRIIVLVDGTVISAPEESVGEGRTLEIRTNKSGGRTARLSGTVDKERLAKEKKKPKAKGKPKGENKSTRSAR